jgi:light-regulated signal transduction histidine kinase (bacteriophytochrome)
LLAQRSAELLRINEELLRVNADLDSFAYAASHDLKEPLRTINQTIFFLQRALQQQQPEEVQRRVQTIQRTTQRMTELLEGLLRVSRAGSSDLRLEPTRLEDVVHDAAELAIEHVAKDSTQLIVRELPTVYADFMCMRDVFQNLFSNARKYCTADIKRIEVGTVKVGPEHSPPPSAQGRTAVYVRDNGIGIANERLQDVFQVFRRLHQPNEFGGGSGVGLAIVKRVVERHGGVVWATSQAGCGSTFYFTMEALNHGE